MMIPKYIMSITAKCADQFVANLSKDGKSVGKEYVGYVPDFMPGKHYGDYVELDIDIVTGQIVNWKRLTTGDIKRTFEVK